MHRAAHLLPGIIARHGALGLVACVAPDARAGKCARQRARDREAGVALRSPAAPGDALRVVGVPSDKGNRKADF